MLLFMEFNGWSNGETWAVWKWIAADPHRFQIYLQMAATSIVTDCDLPAQLKAYIGRVPNKIYGLHRDLLKMTFATVSWTELAHKLSDIARASVDDRRNGSSKKPP